MDDPKSWLTLARAPSLHAGHPALKNSGAPQPTGLLRESRTSLAALGLSEATIEALKNPDPQAVAGDERWLGGARRHLVTWGSVDYPPLLASVVPHAVAMTLGGVLIALAHLVNLRLSWGHSH